MIVTNCGSSKPPFLRPHLPTSFSLSEEPNTVYLSHKIESTLDKFLRLVDSPRHFADELVVGSRGAHTHNSETTTNDGSNPAFSIAET